MKYIVETLKLMDILKDYFNIPFNKDNKYYSIIEYIIEHKDTLTLSYDLMDKIVNYLSLLDVEKEKVVTYKLLNPNTSIESVKTEDIQRVSVTDLNDTQLLSYLTKVLKSVTYVQKGNLLLVKYSKAIWEVGWNNLAKNSRGKVFNINTFEIVSYPFNKFFNLNEVEETNIDRIREILNNAEYVSVTDKKDGSAIIVTNNKGNIIINTNGEFNNNQVNLATKMLEEKYSYFYKNIPEGYTFVFELIHPKNRIILDYGNEETLYLLAIRDLTTFKLKTYEELIQFSSEYKLDITESFVFTNLDDFMDKAFNETQDIKEGWVFRVISGSEDVIFKLKYAEYFKLARMKSKPSLKKVYELLLKDTLDDVLANADDEIKNYINTEVKVIYDYIDMFKALIQEESLLVLKKLNIETVDSYNVRFIASELKGNPFIAYILRVLKNEISFDNVFGSLPTSGAFEKLYNHTNIKLNIKTVGWNESVE